MGRSGGGGGGHRSSGHSGGGHHGSSHRGSSSFRSSGSSFHSGHSGGGYGGPRPHYDHGPHYNHGPHYHYHGPGYPPPPPPPHRHYYGRRSSGGGCGSIIILMIILIIISSFMQANGGYTGGSISDSNLSEYAEKQYQSIFNGREDCLLIVLDENDDGQIKYGAKANYILDDYQNYLWDAYDRNYNDDLGIQLKGMFEATAAVIQQDGVIPLTPEKSFDSHCYRDDINWVDTKGNLVDGAKAFYDATGIQAYVLLVKAKTIAKATNKSSGVLKVLIIAAAVIIVVCILFSWWKKRVAQKNKEQEDLERTLNTPLETFGSTPMDDLKAKYDNNNTGGQ